MRFHAALTDLSKNTVILCQKDRAIKQIARDGANQLPVMTCNQVAGMLRREGVIILACGDQSEPAQSIRFNPAACNGSNQQSTGTANPAGSDWNSYHRMSNSDHSGEQD